MKTAITDTLKVMFVYTVISILIMLGMNNQHFEWSDWLSPLNHIILLDLIPIEGFNMERTPISNYIEYYESEARELACIIANTILIATAHFLSFRLESKRKRIIFNTLTATIVTGWTIFIIIGTTLASAG
jgi:hypothetical protein